MSEPTPQTETPFVVGDMVEVHGLKRRAELNGQTGTLRSFEAGKGRWVIRLGSGTLHNVRLPSAGMFFAFAQRKQL